MIETFASELKVKNVEFGYCKLEDETVIIIRVAIVDVRPIGTKSPFGVEFDVSFTTGISAYPSRRTKEEYKDKKILLPGEPLPDSWKRMKIIEMKPAVEEVVYKVNDDKYNIRVEIEPTMASINTERINLKKEPIYVLRWSPKISWDMIKDESMR